MHSISPERLITKKWHNGGWALNLRGKVDQEASGHQMKPNAHYHQTRHTRQYMHLVMEQEVDKLTAKM